MLPPPPSQVSADKTDNHTQATPPGEHAQSDFASSLSHPTAYLQTAHQSQLATALVWLVGSAAADLPANQLALHQAGAVYWLLHQMQWSRSSALVTGAMWALASLAKDNADVQSEVQLQVPFVFADVLRGVMPVMHLVILHLVDYTLSYFAFSILYIQ